MKLYTSKPSIDDKYDRKNWRTRNKTNNIYNNNKIYTFEKVDKYNYLQVTENNGLKVTSRASLSFLFDVLSNFVFFNILSYRVFSLCKIKCVYRDPLKR